MVAQETKYYNGATQPRKKYKRRSYRTSVTKWENTQTKTINGNTNKAGPIKEQSHKNEETPRREDALHQQPSLDLEETPTFLRH